MQERPDRWERQKMRDRRLEARDQRQEGEMQI